MSLALSYALSVYHGAELSYRDVAVFSSNLEQIRQDLMIKYPVSDLIELDSRFRQKFPCKVGWVQLFAALGCLEKVKELSKNLSPQDIAYPARYGRLEIVKYMIQQLLYRPKDAIYSAGLGGHNHIVDYLYELKPKKLFLAIRGGVKSNRSEFVVTYLAKIDPKIVSFRDKLNCLKTTCEIGNPVIVKALLDFTGFNGYVLRPCLDIAMNSGNATVAGMLANRNAFSSYRFNDLDQSDIDEIMSLMIR